MKEYKVTGLKVPHDNFSEESKEKIRYLAKEYRPLIEKENKENPDMLFGFGYSDDDKLIWAIESSVSEKEFNKDYINWIVAGLEYLAEGDYHRDEKLRYDNPY